MAVVSAIFPLNLSEIILQSEFCTDSASWRLEFQCEYFCEFQDKYSRSILSFMERVKNDDEKFMKKSTPEFTAKFTGTIWGKIHSFVSAEQE